MMREKSLFDQNKSEYYLMNKDNIIASFHVDDLLDSVVIDKKYKKLPEWYNKLGAFISNRRAPKHRENIEKLLRLSGCDTIRGFLDVSHALSLVDTFWVKSVDSDLDWNQISLFRHPFNEVIAKTAFEGGLHGRNLSTTSPEYGTDGSFAKCWIREGESGSLGQIKMLKRGSSGARNAGLEPYSEYYASQLVSVFTSNYVNYNLRSVNNRICSVCDIFTSEKCGFLPYAAIDRGNTTILDIREIFKNYHLEKELKIMLIVDAVILNEDRHKNNFGFLIDNDTLEIVGAAPLFDHNISLLPYGEEENFADIDNYLSMKGPRLYDDWFKMAAAMLDSKSRNILINLLDFKFIRHPKYNLPEWRLDFLENLIHKNIEKILNIKTY